MVFWCRGSIDSNAWGETVFCARRTLLHVGRKNSYDVVSGLGVPAVSCLHINTLHAPRDAFHSKPLPPPQYKTMRRHPVIIHQSPQTQLSHHSSIQTSPMERRPTYEAIKASPTTLTPRNRTASNASASSSSSSSSTSSTSLSRRKLIRDRYKRPWQLMSVITLHHDEMPASRSGGLKSPYPTPGRRNYDRV